MPRLKLPPKSCDAHVHVFGPVARFPFDASRSYTPADAPKEALFALHERLGIERCVVVQPSVHGFDNSVSADAIAARSGAYVGVAVVPLTVSDAELRRLDAAGFRGARFHFTGDISRAPPISEVVTFAGRLADLDWHLQLHFDSALIHDLVPALRRSPVPVVIDHMARVDASAGIDHADFRMLRKLLADIRFWVKVSASERASRQGPPYRDAVPFARTLVADVPGRVLWGTDWPHPNLDHVPDDAMLVDLLEEIAPSDAARRALLVENPARLYRFEVGHSEAQ